jgi:hypothetical protein
LTSPDTTDTAQALVTALRPARSEAWMRAVEPAGSVREPAPRPTWFRVVALVVAGVGVGVAGGIVLGAFAMLLWRKANAP